MQRVRRSAFPIAVVLFMTVPGIANAAGKATTKSPSTKSPSTKAKIVAQGTIRASVTESTVRATTTTLPKPISAGKAISGWESITDAEWPAAGDAVIASAIGNSVEVFRTPGNRTGVLRLDSGRSVFGSLRLLALSARDDYVRVAIPIRPNGTVGWVKRSEVSLAPTALRVVIELSTNTLRVTDGDATVIRVPVAAGTGGTPTPTGLFFLKELVPQSNPSGALGPFAFGLSGFSTVLTSFGGGEGVIGIHGTNAPGKLGGDVSHGCVRVDNTTIRKLAALLPLGTPVEIVNRLDSLPPKAFRVPSNWMFSGAAAGPIAAIPATGSLTPTSTTASLTSTPTSVPDVTTTSTSAATTPSTTPTP